MNRYEAKINITDTIYKVFSTPLFTGDIGNTVHLEFFMRGKPYAASNANIYKLMADGKSASVAVAMKDNVCEFTIPNIMHSNASESEIELQIALLDDVGNILTSGVLRFEVKEGLSEKAQIAGTDEYNDMTALLSQTAKAASAANEAAAKAEQAGADLNTNKVFRYKGSKDTYNDLPSKPSMGDVYNIKSAYKTKAYGVNVTKIDSVNIAYDEGSELATGRYFLYVNDTSVFNTGDYIEMLDENGITAGGFTVQSKNSEALYADYGGPDVLDAQGLKEICDYLFFKHKTETSVSYSTEIDKMYYFTGISETPDSIEININAGENVVWNGFEWDNLGGTVDLSAYITKEESVGKKTEGEGEIFNNPDNQALTTHSHASGGGDGEEPNIAGKMAYLICGVYDKQFVIEAPENGKLPSVGDVVNYAIPASGTAWSETGKPCTIASVGVTQTAYPISSIPTANRISDSDTGYFVITLNETPQLKMEDISMSKWSGDIRDRRINARMWINAKPDHGNYQIAKAATAIGKNTRAIGDASFATGRNSKAIGPYSIAGSGEASGEQSVSLAGAAKAAGTRSAAIGAYAEANEDYTLALGSNVRANHEYTIVIGHGVNSAEGHSIVLGIGKQALVVREDGSVEILGTITAPNIYDKSEVDEKTSKGYNNTESGEHSFATGIITMAEGQATFTSGYSNLAQGDHSSAGGTASRAFGKGSLAHGDSAFAYADYSVALGVMPEYDGYKKLLLNIGNGNHDGGADNRSSALKLDFDGNLIIQGGLTANNIYTKDETKALLSAAIGDTLGGEY